MVEHGISAKQEKEGRLLDIKREVTEMVRNRVTSLQFQVLQQLNQRIDYLEVYRLVPSLEIAV